MKRIFLLWIALSYGTSAFAQFDLRFSVPYSYFMEDVFYADSNTTLISGSNYYATTLDGGQNWHGLSSAGMFVKASFYSSNRFGIAVGNDGKYRINTECAYFWGWGNIKYIGIGQDLNDAFFINDHKGIVCGDAGTLLKTDNQASNWTSIETPNDSNLTGVHMVNDSIAFVCGNGGIVYNLKHDSVFSSQVIDAAVNFSKIFFVNDTKGFVLGSNGSLYSTSDQGSTWQFIDLGITDKLLNIDFSNELHGSVCGENGVIFSTFDGGNTWTQGQVVPEEEIRAIAYKNNTIGLAVGSSFVLYTDDGGLTWMRITGGLRAIDFPSDLEGYAVGFNGSAFRSKDGGNNWQPMNLNTPQYLNDVQFLNPDTGYVVGGHEIFRTVDGGDTWTSIDNPTDGSLYGVHFTDYYHGVAVGYKRSIMYTDDGGETWDYDYNWNSGVWYLDIQFTSDDIGYFCSSSGVMYKTINGGEDWTVQSTGANTGLAEIYFLNDSTGWAVGSEGRIIKTTNGGEDWTLQTSGVDTYLGGIEFFHPDSGIVLGSDGTYLFTYDGGDTWLNFSSGYYDWGGLSISPNGTPFTIASSSVAAIAPFSTSSMNYARCGGDRLYYNTFTPYFDNNETRTVLVEMTSINDDYSNAIPLLTVELDSTTLIDAYLPEGLPEAVYKYRLRDINDPTWTSFDRRFKMTTTPQIDISIVDSIAYAVTNQDVQVSWYYRESPAQSGYWIGNGDSIQLPGTGELFVNGSSDCCDATIPWTMIGECNGELILQDEFAVESDYTLCNGDSVLIAGLYYSSEGIYIDSLTNSLGCDSVLISTISIVFPDSVFINTSICSNESYQIGSSIYTESGSYIDTLINVNGCDSIVYLELSVFPISTVAIDSSICYGDSVLMASNYYSQSGFYIDTLLNLVGCDSIISLNLAVLFQGDSIQSFSICEGDSIVVASSVYEQSGNYIDSVYNEQDCLTVFYTSVVVNENPTVFLGNDTTICNDDFLTLDAGDAFESYLWNTNEVSQTIVVNSENEYSVEVSDINGCLGSDSIYLSVDICSSIEELETAYGIQVFPNPSNGDFTVESAGNIGLNIYRSDGGLVFHKEILSSSERITLQESGLYLMHFILENERVIHYSLVVNK